MKPVWVLLTTYQRLDTALKTIDGIKTNLRYDNIGWIVTDDGSGDNYLETLVRAIGPSYSVHTYNGNRKGVGHNMNWGLNKIWELDGEYVLMMEDDWYLEKPLDFIPYVRLLENPHFGMIRMGYLSAGLQAQLISEEGKLWWEFEKNNYQYIFTGHASLRHKRFHEIYGYYKEGLTPGFTELDMCAKFNAKDGPSIVFPAEYNNWGVFSHIGTRSLADTEVGS